MHRKASEDRAAELAAVIAFYAFFSIFPALLAVGTAGAMLLEGDDELREQFVEAVVDQFPDSPELRDAAMTVEGSGIALLIGLAGAVWGATGAVGALRSAFDRVWAVPVRARAGWPRAPLTNLAVGLVVAIGLVASVLVAGIGRLTGDIPIAGQVGGVVGSVALVLVVFGGVFRILSPRDVGTRHLLPGILLAAGAWLVLQQAGSMLIDRQVASGGAAASVFTAALVLLTWLALQARVTVLAAELAAVLHRHWWPRSVDAARTRVPDRRTLRAHAATEERVPGEAVAVTFGPPPDDA